MKLSTKVKKHKYFCSQNDTDEELKNAYEMSPQIFLKRIKGFNADNNKLLYIEV